jgi:hypothetical protein
MVVHLCPATERVEEREQARSQPTPPELTLIQELEQRARTDGFSDRALMRAVGLDPTLLGRVRRGEYRFGPETCAKIVGRFPDLRAAAARYLADSYGSPALQLLAEAASYARARQGGHARRACR